MKKRILTGLALIIVLVSGGIFIYHKLTKPDLGPKTTKLYQHGFQLLEDQIGTYIKEHYTGIDRIEFSPIYVTGDDGSSMLNAEIVPIVYDRQGNKGIFGGKYQNFYHSTYGLVGSLFVDYDDLGEYFELRSDSGEMLEVEFGNSLPQKVRRTKMEAIDLNMKDLILQGKLKGVEKSFKGSPNAEVIYNLELKKGVIPNVTK
ncbi:hypothetical protein [Streptococcus australis]|uniref:hypothetical protein n=1 Tax=Streptococcus australis TaxID=113107 RepID=UPI0023305F40|nr:hypothetical protein [Streptococcus australis]MDB8641786.1 hypothetical protein [Streptococcus australis]MDB8645453.1 hypothetical protein [Streptococcus australis]